MKPKNKHQNPFLKHKPIEQTQAYREKIRPKPKDRESEADELGLTLAIVSFLADVCVICEWRVGNVVRVVDT